jgi:hypothetical protein
MDKEFEVLSGDEVLFVRAGRIVMTNPTFKVSEFLDALAQSVSEQEEEWSEEKEGWFMNRGQSCEVLRFGNQGWQRGRVRIRLEFCPEPPPKLLGEGGQQRDDLYPQDERRIREDIYPREDVYQRRNRRGNYPPQNDYQWESNEIYPEVEDEY